MSAGLTPRSMVLPIVIITSPRRSEPSPTRSARPASGSAPPAGDNRSHVLPYAAPGILTGRSSAWPARGRGRAAHPGGRDHRVPGHRRRAKFIETLQGPFLALRPPSSTSPAAGGDFRNDLTPAAIVVLLVIVFWPLRGHPPAQPLRPEKVNMSSTESAREGSSATRPAESAVRSRAPSCGSSRAENSPAQDVGKDIFELENLDLYYGSFRAVRGVKHGDPASARSPRSSVRRLRQGPRCCAASTA